MDNNRAPMREVLIMVGFILFVTGLALIVFRSWVAAAIVFAFLYYLAACVRGVTAMVVGHHGFWKSVKLGALWFIGR